MLQKQWQDFDLDQALGMAGVIDRTKYPGTREGETQTIYTHGGNWEQVDTIRNEDRQVTHEEAQMTWNKGRVTFLNKTASEVTKKKTQDLTALCQDFLEGLLDIKLEWSIIYLKSNQLCIVDGPLNWYFLISGRSSPLIAPGNCNNDILISDFRLLFFSEVKFGPAMIWEDCSITLVKFF